jgi:hypothetical protein
MGGVTGPPTSTTVGEGVMQTHGRGKRLTPPPPPSNHPPSLSYVSIQRVLNDL